MAYWLDEGWHNWPEILRAGTAAAGLYARCGAYIADKKTDGFIPSELARGYGTPEWIGRLVDAGLWLVEEHGFRDTRYFELNASKADLQKRKDEAAERQRRSRTSRRSHTDVTRDKPVSHSTPVPSPPPLTGEGKGRTEGGHEPDLDPLSRRCRICDFPAANNRHIRAIKDAS